MRGDSVQGFSLVQVKTGFFVPWPWKFRLSDSLNGEWDRVLLGEKGEAETLTKPESLLEPSHQQLESQVPSRETEAGLLPDAKVLNFLSLHLSGQAGWSFPRNPLPPGCLNSTFGGD